MLTRLITPVLLLVTICGVAAHRLVHIGVRQRDRAVIAGRLRSLANEAARHAAS